MTRKDVVPQGLATNNKIADSTYPGVLQKIAVVLNLI